MSKIYLVLIRKLEILHLNRKKMESVLLFSHKSAVFTFVDNAYNNDVRKYWYVRGDLSRKRVIQPVRLECTTDSSLIELLSILL